ncbi:MAG: DUF1800 domain-containing protein [Myxococcales bacterium]|nr:DUF1800 domain-containing protein [Myxococcales bacterium]
MIRTAVVAAVLAVACSRGARKDVTAAVADEAPEAAAREAAATDAPALTHAEMVEHVLSRVSFGANQGERARVEQMGISAYLEEQLHPEQIDDSALEQRLAAFPALQKSVGELVQTLVAQRRMRQREQRDDEMLGKAPPPPAGVSRELRKSLGKAGRGPGFETVAQLSQAKVLRAVASKRQLQEELVDFWFNHFNVFAGKETESALLPRYENGVVRPNALATFPELLEATAHSPAMLIYLDNWRSSAPAPRWLKKNRNAPKRGLNENYARELLELHTLGVDGGYTQKDIVEVARCFTGWTVDEPQKDPHFVFRKGLHDFGEKHVLGHLIPAGHGVEDGARVLEILEEHPSTARFIARKLARRFVSDDPPDTLVAKVAETYTRTHGDIRSMLRTIFESPEFWSRKALKAKVRSPLELVAALVRGLDATVDDPMALARAVARIGEPLYAAQPPTGYPDSAQTWLSSGALLARIDFGLQLANGRLEGVKIDLSRLGDGPPEEILNKAALELGATELSETTRDYILKDAGNAPRVVGMLLGAPEIQRR